VDIDQPSVARVYDYYLGGSHNFQADRAFAAQVIAAMPDVPWLVHENRAFLRRAVRFMAQSGIEQFVDLGSGIPTVGNVHEIVAAVNPAGRVVYVDHDPIAVAHSRAILDGNPNATVIPADLRKPLDVLAHPDTRRMVDPDRPVGLILNAVLHFVPDDAEAAGIIAVLAERVAPGSYIALSHASMDQTPDGGHRAESLYNRSITAMATRTHAEVLALFGDLPLVDPGLVQIPMWRPESPDDVGPQAQRYPGYAGVARVG
jgi:SAM-dependent methyltransferase